MSHKFSNLFDEEKEELGDLPREMQSLMESYLWHYRNDESWTVHEVEKTIEVPLPFLSGVTLKLRLDMLVEDEYGLWVVDHKTHKRSEEHTSELQSLMRISYAVFCLKKKKKRRTSQQTTYKKYTISNRKTYS